MKLSFTTLATPELNGVEAIRQAKKYGYNGIDLRASEDSGEVSLNSSDEELYVIKEELNAQSITLSSLLCYNEPMGAESEAFSKAVDSIKLHIELAVKLGAVSVRIFAGHKELQSHFDSQFETICGILSKVAEDSKNVVDILIQNHYNNLNAFECSKVIKAVNRTNLGFLLSPDHCLITGENLDDILNETKGITRQVFIADVIKRKNIYEYILPGMGTVPMNRVIQNVGGKLFDGWLSFKWERYWHPELAEYKVALPHFIRYVKELQGDL